MTLPVPHLDDRAFLDLVTEARERIRASCPDWTDLSAHDPGITGSSRTAATRIASATLNRTSSRRPGCDASFATFHGAVEAMYSLVASTNLNAAAAASCSA